MTPPNEPRSVDSDRVDAGRGLWRSVLGVSVLGLLLGGLLGALYGGSQATTYQSSSALSVLPDSSVDTQAQTSAPDQDATAFIQSQLVVLNGDQLAGQVAKKLGLSAKPKVSATQVGQTYVVQLTGTAATQAQATRIVGETGTEFAALRASQLTSEINTAIDANKTALAAVQKNLTAAQAANPTPGNPTPVENSLQNEYQRLLSVNSSLTSTLPQVTRVVTLLSPATSSNAALSGATKDTAGGALVGAVLALMTLIVLRRTISRVRSVGDLAELEVPVLLPVLPLRSRGSVRTLSAWRSSAARLLATRIQGDPAAAGGPIVVVGATPSVGASHVALSLAASLVGRGPVLLVLAANPTTVEDDWSAASADNPPDSVEGGGKAIDRVRQSAISGVWVLTTAAQHDESGLGARSAEVVSTVRRATNAGWTVVLDAPALSNSDLALDCLSSAGGVAALIVARGKSRPADVVGAVELFESRGTALAGVVLNAVPGALARLLPGRTDPAAMIARSSAGGDPALKGAGVSKAPPTAPARTRVPANRGSDPAS